MIQDVIDLRSSKWVPRRQDLNPKTIDQIQKEAEHEQMNIHMMNSVPMTPRKDDRSNQGPPNSDRKGGRGGRNVTDDGWMTMNTNRNRTTPFMVQSDKLKSKAPTIDEPFGSSSLFGAWGKGSVGSNNNKTPGAGPNTANMYAALENMEPDKRNLNTRPGSKDPYHSKGPSLERNYNKYDGRGSRSGSQHSSNYTSCRHTQAGSQPLPVETPQLTEDQIMRRITNSLEEYISGNCTVDEYFTEITVDMLAGYLPRAISESYLYVLEKSQHLRLKTGSLFANLIKQGRIQLVDYSAGLKDILSQADDLKIDIPKIWDYLSELLVDLVCEEALPLKELFSYFLILIDQRQADKLLAPLFKLVVSKKGPDFLSSIWNKSGLQLREFVPNNSVDSFIADNQFEFLTGHSSCWTKSTFLRQHSGNVI
ncbi:hypothetical protein JTB14_037626 [Gonioctena quinquepunctata]|nr:hypothetical protein JTB14_037626 [Gonioctena quinquepunctata]